MTLFAIMTPQGVNPPEYIRFEHTFDKLGIIIYNNNEVFSLHNVHKFEFVRKWKSRTKTYDIIRAIQTYSRWAPTNHLLEYNYYIVIDTATAKCIGYFPYEAKASLCQTSNRLTRTIRFDVDFDKGELYDPKNKITYGIDPEYNIIPGQFSLDPPLSPNDRPYKIEPKYIAPKK